MKKSHKAANNKEADPMQSPRLAQLERDVKVARKKAHEAKLNFKEAKKALKHAKKAVKHARKLAKTTSKGVSKKKSLPNPTKKPELASKRGNLKTPVAQPAKEFPTGI